jgi:hypothetical protein
MGVRLIGVTNKNAGFVMVMGLIKRFEVQCIMKQLSGQFHCTYELLRYLDLNIWRVLCANDNRRTNRLLYPLRMCTE